MRALTYWEPNRRTLLNFSEFLSFLLSYVENSELNSRGLSLGPCRSLISFDGVGEGGGSNTNFQKRSFAARQEALARWFSAS